MKAATRIRLVLPFLIASIAGNVGVIRRPASALPDDPIAAAVARAVIPAMRTYGIPGMAVGIAIDGRNAVFNFGRASKSGPHVDGGTLFEIGSVTKTFTSTLVSYASVTGKLALSDKVSADLSILRGSSFDAVRLRNLGTYTAGGLPLQFPDDVKTDCDAFRYYRRWRPSHAPGTYRLYSNPSAMLLGVIAASKLGAEFTLAMRRIVLEPLGLHDTLFVVPTDEMSHYAQGYTEAGKPIRMTAGPLAPQAYGIRTTAADMLRFIDANMKLRRVGEPLRQALLATRAGYYQIDGMTQDLVWEQYSYPVKLATLLQGNSEQIMIEDNPVRAFQTPRSPTDDVWIDKTGSTNGFAAYVAFVPKRKIGIVLLANRSYPIQARVTIAYRILAELDQR